jgi:hypothetical protein
MRTNEFLASANKSIGNVPLDLKQLSNIPSFDIVDKSYRDFLSIINGGIFFDNSLHIYGIGYQNNLTHLDLFVKNTIVHKFFREISKGLLFFGEEIFGNQYAFADDGIYFFHIDDGSFEKLADSFSDWMNIVYDDLDYYTGRTITREWSGKIHPLPLDCLLCPKTPFITGGAYELDNLHVLPWEKCIDYNSNIAKQVRNLPQGTEISFQ